MMQEGNNRSTAELIAELSQETVTLGRKEVQLAEAEITRKAYRAGKNVGLLVAGGAVAYAGLLALEAGTIAFIGKDTQTS